MSQLPALLDILDRRIAGALVCGIAVRGPQVASPRGVEPVNEFERFVVDEVDRAVEVVARDHVPVVDGILQARGVIDYIGINNVDCALTQYRNNIEVIHPQTLVTDTIALSVPDVEQVVDVLARMGVARVVCHRVDEFLLSNDRNDDLRNFHITAVDDFGRAVSAASTNGIFKRLSITSLAGIVAVLLSDQHFLL